MTFKATITRTWQMTMWNVRSLDNRENLYAVAKHDPGSGCIVMLVSEADGRPPVGAVPLAATFSRSLFVLPSYVLRMREIVGARGGEVRQGEYPATVIPVPGYSYGFVFHPAGGSVVLPEAPESLPEGYYNRVVKRKDEMGVELVKGTGFVLSRAACSVFGNSRNVVVLKEDRKVMIHANKRGAHRLTRPTASSRLLMLADPEIKYETEQIAVPCERWGERGIMFMVPDIVEFGHGGSDD